MPSATAIELSRVKPDFNDLVTQLNSALASKPAWKDFLTTATGQHLIEFIAAIGAFSQYNIESTFQEEFLSTAKLDSSIFAITRMLGVRLGRKTPASTKVTLNRIITNVGLTIPPYSQFSTPSGFLYNRTEIIFNAGVLQLTNITLYEGEVKRITLTGGVDDSGLPVNVKNVDFQTYVSPEKSFTPADRDLVVTVDNISIPVVTDGLWHYKTTPAVQNATSAEGNLEVIFGNTAFGFKPPLGSSIVITYVVTRGEEANNLNFAGTALIYNNAPSNITGVTNATANGNLAGGAAQLSGSTYRELSPLLYAAGDRAVTQDDYEAHSINYASTIKDARCLGQRDLAPYNLKYMNLVQVTLVTDPVWTTQQWTDFFDLYLRKKAMYSTVFYRKDPIPILVDIIADVYCYNTVDLASVQSAILSNLQTYLEAKRGILGRNVYKSDIYETIENAHENIDYIVLKTPLLDTYVNLEKPRSMQTTAIAGNGGTLVAGTYRYYLTATNASGENLPFQIPITTTSTGLVQITWETVANAVTYRLYGRGLNPGNVGLIAIIPNTQNVYNDLGTIVPNASLLPSDLDTSGSNISYPKLGNTQLNMYFSNRNVEIPRLINL